jgi:hypothetical protein
MYGAKERCIQDFDSETSRKEPLGRPGRGSENNITMDLQEVEWVAWTGLSWFRIGTGGGLL